MDGIDELLEVSTMLNSFTSVGTSLNFFLWMTYILPNPSFRFSPFWFQKTKRLAIKVQPEINGKIQYSFHNVLCSIA